MRVRTDSPRLQPRWFVAFIYGLNMWPTRGEGDIASPPREEALISRLVLDTACDLVLRAHFAFVFDPLPSIIRAPVRLLSLQPHADSTPLPSSSSFLGLLFRRPFNHVFSELPASLESQRSFGPKNRNEAK